MAKAIRKEIRMSQNILSEFLFQSRYIDILDSTIHYIDESVYSDYETTFLLLHGNPTSSYLWRNIIPYLTPLGRVIAPDLIGFGKSSKPDCDYSYQSHIKYLDAFIKGLDITNIVLVVHDWGGALGFNYAKRNESNIKGIVFMETFCKPMEWGDLTPLTRFVFKQFRDPLKGQKWNGKYNLFLRFILQSAVIRKLSFTEKQKYLEPFPTIESRIPIVKLPQELPFNGEETLNTKIVSEYYQWLKITKIQKLLVYASPGVQIKKRQVEQYKVEFANLTTAFVGKGKHYIQEDQPDNIGEAIEQWYLMKL